MSIRLLVIMAVGLFAIPVRGEVPAKGVLKGQAAQGDWTTDAPGVRRLITLADLPAAGATKSVDNGPQKAAQPKDAWPKAPAGFVVELGAEALTNPPKIIAASNGDVVVASSSACVLM